MSESKHVYLTLDGLRGIAALAVVMIHIDPALGGTILPHAYLAVDMFFVMSGIVIAHAYERRFEAGMKTAEFMRLRLIRLYPLYFLGTVIAMLAIAGAIVGGVGLAGWTRANLPMAIVPSILMLPAYAPGVPTVYPLNPPAWSLFFELVANFFYVAFFPFLTNRVLLAVIGAAGLGLVAAAATSPNFYIGGDWKTFYAGIPRVFWSFPLGVLIYRYRAQLPKLPAHPVVLGILTVAIFAPHVPARLASSWDLLALVVLMPAICVSAISNEPSRGKDAFLWLGAISYPIYILHDGLYKIYERAIEMLSDSPIEQLAPWAGILFLASVAVAATVVDRLYDRPVRRYLGRRQARPAQFAKSD